MTLLLLLLCIGAAVLLSRFLIARYGYRNLTYSLAFSKDEVTEGDTVTLLETICSCKPLPLPWVKAELTTDSSLDFASEQSAVSEETRFVSSYFCLYPYRQIERRWTVTCTKRGMFTVSHAVIMLSDLFGTMELSRLFPDAEAHLTVLPAVHPVSAVQEFPQRFTGDVIRSRTLIPDRFAVSGTRPYADGDPVRDICWTATARSETPVVWQYQETASPSLTVLLNLETRETDRDRVSDRAVYEDAIRLCAAYLGKAVSMQIPVRLGANTEIDGQPVETRFDQHDLLRHLRILAALPDSISCRFVHLLQRICADDPAASVLVITAQPTADILRRAAADPRITVLSLRPLSDAVRLQNVRHIPPFKLRGD